MLSERYEKLLNKCAKGEVVLLVAPKEGEFGNGTLRLEIDNGEISVISKNGKEVSSALSVEDISKQLGDGWAIKEAFNNEGLI